MSLLRQLYFPEVGGNSVPSVLWQLHLKDWSSVRSSASENIAILKLCDCSNNLFLIKFSRGAPATPDPAILAPAS